MASNNVDFTKKILECIQTLPITWALLLESITLVKMSKKLRKKKYSKDIATRKLANDIYISLQALQPAEVLAHQKQKAEEDDGWDEEEEEEDWFTYFAEDDETCTMIVRRFKKMHGFDIEL